MKSTCSTIYSRAVAGASRAEAFGAELSALPVRGLCGSAGGRPGTSRPVHGGLRVRVESRLSPAFDGHDAIGAARPLQDPCNSSFAAAFWMASRDFLKRSAP